MRMRKWLLLAGALVGLSSSPASADSTVASLTAASALSGLELLYCTQSSADRKCTISQWATYLTALANTWSGVNTFTQTNGIVIQPSGDKAWQLMQSPTGTTALAVPAFYPVANNSLLAFDLIPHGSPTDLGYGKTWFDACNTDLVANINAASNCLHLGVRAAQIDLMSAEYGGATQIPLHIGIFNGDTATPTDSVSIDSVWNESNGVAGKIRVVTASGAIVGATSDHFICVNKTVGAASAVSLWASPRAGSEIIVMDCKGDAASNNITITPNAGNIDGAGTLVISTNYGTARLIYTGTIWKTW